LRIKKLLKKFKYLMKINVSFFCHSKFTSSSIRFCMKKIISIYLLLQLVSSALLAQPLSNDEIKKRISSYKVDARGPFKEIRWFCPDGTIIPPQERCPMPGGVQRANLKDEVKSLGVTNHLYLGQILSTTPYPEFWDAAYYNSRLKQYNIEKYLQGVDDGWILRKAQYYRGAFQVEDEEQWGVNFFNWLLVQNEVSEKQFFLVRQAAKDIPHQGDDNLKQNIRMNSKLISDSYAPFLNLRVKIHGQPDATDLDKVKVFKDTHKGKMSAKDVELVNALIADLTKEYSEFNINSLDKYTILIPKETELSKSIKSFQNSYQKAGNASDRISLLSEILFELRKSFQIYKSAEVKLAILDISIKLESLLFKEQATYKPRSIQDNLDNIYLLSQAAAGCGYIELWEWEKIKTRIGYGQNQQLSQVELMQILMSCRNVVDWGTGMFIAVYDDVVHQFSGFEPLAEGFLDDQVRSSLLLQLGISLNNLRSQISNQLPVSNKIMNIRDQDEARGLNPGFALGELVVLTGSLENTEFDANKIYIVNRPPADLKPVAGIATVSEGNPVSHVQLLARNLGIPNAVVSMNVLEQLKEDSGKTVFYAVSPRGTVVLKLQDQMNRQELALFEKKKRELTKVTVPVEKIDLKYQQIADLRKVNATSSGKMCGPKAANLGQLKQLFPEHVVEGLVIPFGIFRTHLDQLMPGQKVSYWEYLNGVFRHAAELKKSGTLQHDIDNYMLAELQNFRGAIAKIELSEKFVNEISLQFEKVLGKEIGEIPVFIRSDTNMEDLKDFTGAGLNLTIFNVLNKDAILKGIRDVWASPYTERSFRWRQSYLNNPENVFPSILIIPSVDVDYSGVVVTKGLGAGRSEDITVAFSRGVGGAVDGQAAESYLLTENGDNMLITPARETQLKTMPSSGGTNTVFAFFNEPILNYENIEDLRQIANRIKSILPSTPGIETQGPFDIELGIKDDKIWLFQVRPFVENKNASGHLYLESLNPVFDHKKFIDITLPYTK
jgi:hypothetical protein